MRGWTRAHPSLTRFFMMVSFPEEAAFTICCSTDLLILALRLCHGTQQVSTAPHRYTRRTCSREERGVRERRDADLVHDRLLDEDGFLRRDVPPAFFHVRSGFVRMARVRRFCLEALGLSLYHFMSLSI